MYGVFVYGLSIEMRTHCICYFPSKTFSKHYVFCQFVPCREFTVYPKKYAHGFWLLCFVVVIHWLIFPYPSGLLHWHCGNLTIAPVPAKQPWWIWINTSFEFIMNDYITTTKHSTTKPCAYFLGYTGYYWDQPKRQDINDHKLQSPVMDKHLLNDTVNQLMSETPTI